MNPEVRLATPADMAQVGAALGRAFSDDPVVSYMVPEGIRGREGRMRRFMAVPAKAALRHHSVYTTEDVAGAAVWKPPGQWRTSTWEMFPSTPVMLRTLGRRLPKAFALLQAMEAHHPAEPHWYLEILGTDPVHQGKGIGAALMAPVLQRCDAEGVPAYLESSKEANIAYYERRGFRVTEELRPVGGDLRVWQMWRDPRPELA